MRCFSLATAFSHGDFRFRLKQAGYSLFDLMITSGVVSVLGIGAVGMTSMVQDARMTSEVNGLITHLSLVRSETIKRGQKVVLCPSADGSNCDEPRDGYTWWHSGYLLFVNMDKDTDRNSNEPIIRMRQALPGGVTIKSSDDRSRITYQSTGFSSGSTATFTFCDPRGQAQVRYVILSNVGRARVSRIPSDGKADEGIETCS